MTEQVACPRSCLVLTPSELESLLQGCISQMHLAYADDMVVESVGLEVRQSLNRIWTLLLMIHF